MQLEGREDQNSAEHPHLGQEEAKATPLPGPAHTNHAPSFLRRGAGRENQDGRAHLNVCPEWLPRPLAASNSSYSGRARRSRPISALGRGGRGGMRRGSGRGVVVINPSADLAPLGLRASGSRRRGSPRFAASRVAQVWLGCARVLRAGIPGCTLLGSASAPRTDPLSPNRTLWKLLAWWCDRATRGASDLPSRRINSRVPSAS